ncbi:Txe/YoeB family addiction module toxin [Fusobacterium sp. PH5-44]|uniref:Txe/YoeB family addiction module toxin n=1 Tax=unclassified Fusobacterium TaxID=2648384 RepID=UPI003D19B1FD
MVEYKILILKQALKDKEKIKNQPALRKTTEKLIEMLKENPYKNPPPYESLVGNLKGLFSRRINIQHRLVYRILEEEKSVLIVSMWTHYEF